MQLAALLTIGLVFGQHGGKPNDVTKELARLDGNWQIVSVEDSGKEIPQGSGAPDAIEIKKGKATFVVGKKAIPTMKNLTLNLNSETDPKSMVLLRGKKDGLPCLYEVTDDQLKIAMPKVSAKGSGDPPVPAPKSFDSVREKIIVMRAKKTKT